MNKLTYTAPQAVAIRLEPSTILASSNVPEIKQGTEIPEGDLSDIDNL